MSVSAWDCAAAGEHGASLIALFVLWIVCLTCVHQRRDPLRRPFLWLKLAMPNFFLFVAVYEAIMIINLMDPKEPLYQATSRMAPIGSFFSSVTDALILLCLVELAISFLRAFANEHRGLKVIRYCNFCAVAILLVLAIAILVADEDLATKYLHGSYVSRKTVSSLYGAWNVMYWILALGLTALSIYVLVTSIRQKRLRSLTRRYLATSLLNLLRTTWLLYIAAKYQFSTAPIVPRYVQVVDPIVYTWVTTTMLALLIAIGMNRHGLYSQPQYQPPPAYTQPYGAGNFNLYQQPVHAEIAGSAPLAWRPELATTGPAPQYCGQQQHAIHPPVEAATYPHRSAQSEVHEVSGGAAAAMRPGWVPWSSNPRQLQGQTTRVYEVAGMREQK